MFILGVGVWSIYAVGRYWLGWDVTDRDFLPYHFAGVIPGLILWQHRFLRGFVGKWRQRGCDESSE